jgi:hypothetical protein
MLLVACLREPLLHRCTVAIAIGCEGIADFLYEYINTIFLPSCGTAEADRVWCTRVEVRETNNNMAGRQGAREDNEFID